MIAGIYVVRDDRTCFHKPAVFDNDSEAVRNFAVLMNSNPVYSKFAADYRLYKVGVFDTDNGQISDCDVTLICDAYSVLFEED